VADEQPAWDDLRLLLEVHRRGSFLGAAQQLGRSTATVARRIAALERLLGRRLVQRSSQGTRIDNDGAGLVAFAEELERAIAAYRRDGSGRSPHAGVVRVSIPDGFMPATIEAIEMVRSKHPETFVEVSVEARFVDLSAREADIGIRGARSSSAVLLERAVGEVHAGIFASETYLERRLPKRSLAVEDWGAQDFITGDAPHGPTEWLRARGAVHFPLKVSTFEGRLDAAERGLGLVVAGVSIGHSRRLARVRLEAPLPTQPFYLVMHQDLRAVPRVRVVADALLEVLAKESSRQAEAEASFHRRPRKRTRGDNAPEGADRVITPIRRPREE
jgi:DNA-binding transcriptional LysR family regulator